MSDADETRDPLEVVAEEFAERCRRGEHPSIEEYAAKYPPLAEQIREAFSAILALEDLKTERRVERLAATPPERLADFRIIRVLGRGGMGVVYEAEQESLGRRVAIKVLADSYAMSAQAVRRFRREAQATARLHHTNIVSVFGVGEYEGKHFYVMQYIEGRSLDRVMGELGERGHPVFPEGRVPVPEQGGETAATEDFLGAAVVLAMQRGEFEPVSPQPAGEGVSRSSRDAREPAPRLESLSRSAKRMQNGLAAAATVRLEKADHRAAAYWRSVAGIGTQVAAALHYAHRQGILHRDIKPSNVILDEKGGAWLTDFGLAKLVDQDDLTHPGDVVGTLRYMAPEQLEGAATASSDLYSLGLTLYELLTLRPAFNETSRHRLLRQVSREEPPRPRAIDPDIPRDLETIVLKAVAREPAHRYATAGDLAEDLQRFLEDRPILARRTSALEHGWRWCRRNPVTALLLAFTLFLLVTGAIGASAGYVREARLRGEADAERRRAEANLAIAAEAFDNVFSKVSGGPLPHAFEKTGEEIWIGDVGTPGVGKKDALVLEGLLTFYDRFAEENRDNTKWQRESGKAYRRVGDIQQRLGRFREAEKAYGRAIELFMRLPSGGPEEADCRVELAALHQQLGNTAMASDRFDEAFRQYVLAKETLTRHATSLAVAPVERFQLAEAYRAMGLATFIRRMQSPSTGANAIDASDAEDYIRQAMAILASLLRDAPLRQEYRFSLAECYGNLWGVCRMEERNDEADQAKTRAIRMLEDLLAEFPDNPQYRQTLAWTYAVTSSFSRAENPADAIAPLQRAMALMESLSASYSEVPEYRQILAHVCLDFARALFENGEDSRVEDPLRTSEALFTALRTEFPDVIRHRVGLGRALYLRAVVQNAHGQPEIARETLHRVLEVVGADQRLAQGNTPVSVRLLARTFTGLADVEDQLGEAELSEKAALRARAFWALERDRPFRKFDADSRDPWRSEAQWKQLRENRP